MNEIIERLKNPKPVKKATVRLDFLGVISVYPADDRVYIEAEQREKEILEMTLSLLNSLDELGHREGVFEKAKQEIYSKLGLY